LALILLLYDPAVWYIIVDCCNFMREECQVWLTNSNEQIGGMDANGEPTNTFIVNITLANGGMDTGFLAASKEIQASAS